MESIFVDGNKFTFNIIKYKTMEDIESLEIELEKDDKKYRGGLTDYKDMNWNYDETKYYNINAIHLSTEMLYKILKKKIMNRDCVFNEIGRFINITIKVKIDDDYYEDLKISLKEENNQLR